MRILCYGDSNTWGYIPNINSYTSNAAIKQYDDKNCWWYKLKKDNEVFVNGLCGRCINNESKWREGRNATKTIDKDLSGYNNIDIVIVFLGTNDCKSEYNNTPQLITQNLEKLINKILNKFNAKILIISPPYIENGTPITQKYYMGAKEKTIALDKMYNELATKNNFLFVSAFDCEIGEDGEHLTIVGHATLGEKVSSTILKLNS